MVEDTLTPVEARASAAPLPAPAPVTAPPPVRPGPSTPPPRNLALDDLAALGLAADQAVASGFELSLPDEPPEPELGDTAVAWFWNESLVGAAIQEFEVWSTNSNASPDFMPIRHVRQNEEKYQDVADLVFRGRADHLVNEHAFEAWVEKVRSERTNREVIDRSGLAANLAFGLLTGIVDVPVPALKLGKGALMAGSSLAGAAMAQTAVTESYLYATQEERTAAEVVASIGTAGAFGFIGGSVFDRLMTNTPTTSKTADAFNKAADDLVLVPGQSISSQVSSLSAASAGNVAETFAQRSKPMKVVDGIMSALPGGIGRSPAVVAARASLDKVRSIFGKVADTGIVSADIEAGVRAAEPSAEEIREYWGRVAAAASVDHEAAYGRALARMGDTAPLAGIRSEMPGNALVKLSRDEFDTEVFLALNYPDYKPQVPYAEEVLKARDGWKGMYGRFFGEGQRLGIFGKSGFDESYLPQMWRASKVRENPDRLRSILLDMFQTRFDADWLETRKGMSWDDYEALPLADRQSLQAEWNAENDVWALEKAEATVADLEEQYRLAEAELKYLSKIARQVDSAAGKTAERAAAAEAEYTLRRRDMAKAQADANRATAEALRRGMDAARRAEMARKETFVDTVAGPQFKGAREVFDRRAAAALELEEALRNPGLDKAASQVAAERIQAFEKWDTEWNRFTGRTVDAPADPRLKAPETDPRAQYLKGLADQSNRDGEKWLKYAKRLEDQYDALFSKVYEARDLKAKLETERKRLTTMRKDAEKAKRKARRELNAARGEVERVRADAVSTKDLVDGLLNAIQTRSEFPSGILYEGQVSRTTRSKHRHIRINDPAVARQLVEAGYLQFRPTELAERYSRDIGGRIGLREKFGNEDLEDVVADLNAEYDALRADARAKGDTKLNAKLQAEQEEVVRQLRFMRDVELGHWDSGAQETVGDAILWGSRMARQANYLRFGGSFLLGSITDLATQALQRSPVTVLAKGFTRSAAKTLEGVDSRHLQVLLMGVENNPNANRMAQMFGVSDMVHEYGFGSGMTRKASAGLEQATMYAGGKMSQLNLMAQWNSRLMFVAGHDILANTLELAKRVAAGADLTDKELRDMAFVGLNRSDLAEIAKLNDEFGEEVSAGLRFPLIDKWEATPEGRRMAQRLSMAIDKASKRAVIRPGTADLPPFVSGWLGKIIFQFQSFGYAAINKWFRNMDRMGRNGEAGRVFLSIAWALATGGLSYVIREGLIKGEWDEVEEKISSPAGLAYEAVDRGGLLFVLSPYLNAGLKWSNAVGIPVEYLGLTPSRYKDRTPLNSLLGPSFGLFQDIQEAATADSAEKLRKKLGMLAPYRNLFWMDWALNGN